MVERLAIMLHHGMGDVICALPALRAADQVLGAAGWFDVVVKSGLEASVLESVAWQGQMRILRYYPKSRWHRIADTVRLVLRLHLDRPRVFLAPHVSSPRMAEQLARLIGAPVNVLPAWPDEPAAMRIARQPGEHKADYYARFFAAAGVAMPKERLRFPTLPADAVGEPRLFIAPAVGAVAEQHKGWPPGHFARLISALIQQVPNLPLSLIAAPPERALLDGIVAMLPEEQRGQIDLLTPATPALAAAALVGARGVVTSCSGASHIGAWAGVPIIGIYGPTDPGFTGPYSQQVHVVRKGYACSPCYRTDFISGCGKPVCMTDIGVGDVLPAVRAVMDGQAPAPVPLLLTTQARHPDRHGFGRAA